LQDRLVLETARSIREDFLHQSAFDDRDAYTTLRRQYRMLKVILLFHHLAADELQKGTALERIMGMSVRTHIVKMRYIAPEETEKEFEKTEDEIRGSFPVT
jgi:V/A-type H+-transporting ATPase subunit A